MIDFLALNLLKQSNNYLSDLFKNIEATMIPIKTKADKGRDIKSKPKLSFFVPDEKSWKEAGIKADLIFCIQSSGRISMFEIDFRVSVKRMKIEGKEKFRRGKWVIIWRVFISNHSCFSENPRTSERITFIATLPERTAPVFFVIVSKFLIKAIDIVLLSIICTCIWNLWGNIMALLIWGLSHLLKIFTDKVLWYEYLHNYFVKVLQLLWLKSYCYWYILRLIKRHLNIDCALTDLCYLPTLYLRSFFSISHAYV